MRGGEEMACAHRESSRPACDGAGWPRPGVSRLHCAGSKDCRCLGYRDGEVRPREGCVRDWGAAQYLMPACGLPLPPSTRSLCVYWDVVLNDR